MLLCLDLGILDLDFEFEFEFEYDLIRLVYCMWIMIANIKQEGADIQERNPRIHCPILGKAIKI